MTTTPTTPTRRFLTCVRGSLWLHLVAGLHVALAVVFVLLPLTHLLDYESAMLGAFLHGALWAPTVVVLARRLGPGPLWYLPQMAALGLALLVVPFLTLLAATLVGCPHGVMTGVTFWLMYPVLTGLFTTALFLGLAQVWPGRWMVALAALAPWGSLVWSLWRQLTEPPVFMYDPFFGFFSGAIYDRLIDLQPPFLAARAQHLAFALWPASFLAWRAGVLGRRTGAGLTAGLGAVAFLLYAFSPTVGTRFPGEALARRLGREHTTTHFRIVYSDPEDAFRVRLLAAEAQWHHQELESFFGVAPQGPTTIYFFHDGEQKRRLFGTRDVEVAKPSLRSVFITDSGFPHPSLRHELAHVYAASWTDSPFGAAWSRAFSLGPISVYLPDPGLIEGVAVAADGLQEDEDVHAEARLLMEMGGFVPVEVLFSPAFYGISSARAYVQAGSFIRFLVQTRGQEPVRRLYAGGGPLSRVIDDPGRVQREHRAFLATVPVPGHLRALARERFNRPPIHRQRCVHAVARARQRAQDCAASRDQEGARVALEEALAMDPENLETWMLQLAVTRRLRGAREALPAADRVLKLSGEAAHLQVRARLVHAEAAWMDRDTARAFTHLTAAGGVLSMPGQQREIVLMRELLGMPREAWPALQALFLRPQPAWFWRGALGAAAERHPLLAYLVAGAELASGRWEAAADRFSRLAYASLPDDNFRCEARFRHFLALLLSRRLPEAGEALARYAACPLQERSVEYYRGLVAFLEAHPELDWGPGPAPESW